jgi:hypothetical protein
MIRIFWIYNLEQDFWPKTVNSMLAELLKYPFDRFRF